ncbi:hypothetical protein EDD11_009493 [Mortierella claussenii]|nr:hypothetical protein EDD11_009493 [Mortierella claussenii]
MSVRPVVAQHAALGTVLILLLLCTAAIWHHTLQQSNSAYRTSSSSSSSSSKSSNDNVYGDNPGDMDFIMHVHHSFSPPFDNSYSTTRDILSDVEIRPLIKDPTTPPQSLPSDPFAQYIYQQELSLSDDHSDGNHDSSHLVPPRPAHRTIVVGDIHGSLKGFNGFLSKIRFDRKRDVLILAGDLVAKGPQSLEVIDRAIELDAKCVRGNHDDKVIRWRGYLDSLSLQEREAFIAEQEEGDNVDDDDNEEEGTEYGSGLDSSDLEQQFNADLNLQDSTDDFRKRQRRLESKVPSDLDKRSEHYRIARTMTRAQYSYLLNCPLILTLPKELSVHSIPIHVVHAGIDPQRDILKQRPWVLINVRNVLRDGTPTRKKGKGRGWARLFNEMHTRRSPAKRDFLVVYGHDAGRSLNVMTWSIGLDSGCVYGRQLSGYVVETGEILSASCPRL